MSLRRARSVDGLYAEVADCDLVLVPDAPLADALNRRLDRPHLGPFAVRPRRLAAGRRETAEDRTAFLEVIERTDHGWKEVAHAVGELLQCWEHTGNREAILEFDGYDTTVVRDVVDVMGDLQTTSMQLSQYQIDPDKEVAVVGADQLPPLERSVLPDDYRSVDLFANEDYDLPEVHVFESTAAIVDAVMDAIDPDRADDIAVVLDSGSEYSSLVESALEAAEVPFYGGPGFTDDPHHRAVVQLLRACHRGSDTTVGDVRPLCTQLGIDVPVDHDNKRLDRVDVDGLDWLVDLTGEPETRTFVELLDAYEGRAGVDLDAFHEELATLGLADESVTQSAVDDLASYLDSFEVPVDRENEGVLLADAKAAGHVDRPLVFYLGLDERWTHTAPQRPWVNREDQFDRYIGQFQRMLQNGVDRYYFVQDTRGGEPVTPCLYFHELLDQDVERFTDLPHTTHTRRFPGDGAAFEREPIDVDPESVETISQSSLNTLVNCPRDHLFDRLVDGPDEDYFTEGTMFHDFAEFYVCHSEVVQDADLDELAEHILDEVAPYLTAEEADLRRTKYRLGLQTITAFLDEQAPDPDTFGTPTAAFGSNYFAEHFDRPVDSPITERWFENEELGVKGLIDLVHAADRLLDYKSGSRKRASQVVKRSAVDPPEDTPNYQALLYLTHYRTVQPDQELEFTFFHFLEALDDAVRGELDLDDCLTTVTYYPQSFDTFVGTRAAYDELLDGYNDCVATFDALGFEAYQDIMADRSFPDTTDKAELRDSDFAAAFTAAVEEAVGATVDDPAKGCDQAIRALNGLRRRNYFQDDLDAFEDFVADQLDALNRYQAGDERFPIEGPGGEPNYRRVDHRDLLLEGER
ncbi:PD-(D/E)XK nuclease family protein [Halobacteriales archaeon Cl-PHB]